MGVLNLLHRLLRSCGGRDEKVDPGPTSGEHHVYAADETTSVSTRSRESSLSKPPLQHSDSDESTGSINDADFWWNSTAKTLRTMTSHAGYSSDDEATILDFFQKYIVGSLGARPDRDGKPSSWRSFMTDDFTPMELSWNWGLTSSIQQPTIRLSIEPIGSSAELRSDHWNTHATVRLMRRLERDIPGCDCTIFNLLAPRLAELCARTPAPVPHDPTAVSSPTSMFAAFDLHGGAPTVKAYMTPFAHIADPPRARAIHDFLSPLARSHDWPSLSALLDFTLSPAAAALSLEPLMLAFDCVPLARNRVKIYFRSPHTSFASVLRVLGAHNDRLSSGTAVADLRELWEGIFGVDPALDPEAPLRGCGHQTAGMLYYYEVRPGSPDVTAKLYLPAKHYGVDDGAITRALGAFFRARQQRRLGRPLRGGDGACWGDAYEDMMRAICGHRALGRGLGLHTYVTCSVKGEGIDCTSYINPEVYHRARGDGGDGRWGLGISGAENREGRNGWAGGGLG